MIRRAAVLTALFVAVLASPADPRGQASCQVYGARHPYGVWTVEDVIAGRNGSRVPRRAQRCTLFHPYGRFVDVKGGEPWFYLEIPKTGSTNMKNWLTRRPRHRVTQSYTVIREPLDRFLSGYGTVQRRSIQAGRWPFTHMSEPEQFEAFVDLQTAKGDQLNTYLMGSDTTCIGYHTLSQLWFFELLDRPVTRVMKLENIESALGNFLKRTPLMSRDKVPLRLQDYLGSHANSHEGRSDAANLTRSSPDAIRKVLKYLAQDYACLGYPVPAV